MVEPLSRILGQERAVSLLLRYLSRNAVPPGLLFHGEEGIGKERAARAFAAALLCRSRTEEGACGTCPDCLLLAGESHPNLLHLSPENHYILIEEVRALQEEFSRKAFAERPRVALVVPADRMTVQAANAFLKTLEEPPAGTHLLLVAHRLSALPVTIVSRCQKIPFAPLPRDLVERILGSLPEAREAGSPESIREAAALSGGSPGLALSLLSGEGEGRDRWLSLLSSGAPSRDPSGVTALAAEWKGAQEVGRKLLVPLSLLRDAACIASGANASIMNRDREEPLRAVASSRPADDWADALRDLLAISRMPPQAQKPLLVEAFFFGLRGKGR